MRKTTKKLLVSTCIALMSVNPIYAYSMELVYDGKKHDYTLAPITLYVNGEVAETKIMPPVQIDSRVLVPAREVFEPLGAAVEWKSYEKKIYVSYKDSLMILEPDKQEVWLDGNTVTLDVPAKIINDKIMVPLRFIGENIGLGVEWKGEDRSVHITEGESTPDVPTPEPLPEEKPEELPDVEEKPEEKPDIEDVPESNPIPVLPSEENKLENVLNGILKFYQGDSISLMVDSSMQNFNMTTVDGVTVLPGRIDATALIEASTPITDIEVSKYNGKLVIDIKNSKNRLSSTITVPNNTFIKQIRTSQFASDTTRVVFDLKSGAEAFVSLGEDRREIVVQFTQEELSALALGEDYKGEYVAIEGITPDQMYVEEDKDNNEIIITLFNTTISEMVEWNRIRGTYIDAITTRESGNDSEIVIRVQEDMKFMHTTENVNGNTLVRFGKPLFEFMEYNGTFGNTIKLEMPSGFSLADITVTDVYRDKTILVDLGDDYSDVFSNGTMTIGDGIVESITVENGVTTRLKIKEQIVRAVNVNESNGSLIIELVKPREKYDKILVLDAGHGAHDSGSSGNGVVEKEVNLRQTLAIADYLNTHSDIKIYLTREEDTYPSLTGRTDLANEIEADIFVSVHNNSHNAVSKGTEVLYYPSTTDIRSKQMAQIAQDYIVKECGTYNRGIKARPELVVLNTSKMPAILLEGAFISNPTEAALLKSSVFTQNYARAVGDAIIEMFETMSFR